VPIVFLIIYIIGLFYFCGFVGAWEWAVAGALCLVSFFSPGFGFWIFLAAVPLIVFAANNAPAYFSGVDLFLAFALLGAAGRYWMHRRLNLNERRKVISVVGILVFFSVTPFFRFASLFGWWLPDMIKISWLHLYHGDQLSPLAFVYRGWIWILGALFFFAIRRHAMAPPANLLSRAGATSIPDRGLKRTEGMSWYKLWTLNNGLDWPYWGLLASSLVTAGLSMYDILHNKKNAINYSFVFEERNTYAAFWVLQVGLLAYVWKSQSRILKGAAYLCFALFSFFVFASGSLSGFFGWLAVVGLAVVIFSRNSLAEIFMLSFSRRNWLKLLAVFLFLYFLLPTLALVYPPSDPIAVAENLGQRIRSLIPGKAFQYLRQQRAIFWAAGWEMFMETPVFGVGIGRYYQMSEIYFSRAQIQQLEPGSAYKRENAHNYFLQVAAETGIVGFALFVGFLLWLLVRRWDFRGRSKNSAAGMAIIGLLVMSLTGHPLLVQSIFFMSCAMAALIVDNGSRVSADGCQVSGVGCQASGVGCQGDAAAEPEEDSAKERRPRKAFRRRRMLWISLLGVLMVLYVLHVKSIWNQLPSNFEWGFYTTEGEGKQAYRWTRGLALKLMDRDQLKVLFVRAANPDLPQRAVKVTICADDHVLQELDLRDDAWHAVEMQTQQLPVRFVLGIKSSRTWTPAKYGPPDYRELGVMVRF
jgi:O-antigen ligase